MTLTAVTLTGAPLSVTYYTDPLCAWSWVFEAEWRALRALLGARCTWRYRMGGMIRDWTRYADPLNDVGAPGQMGPHWTAVSRATGVPIDGRLWHDDPPASSYPACAAVKAAELHSAAAGEVYLQRVREAAMRERRNVARPEVLLALAEEVAAAQGEVGGAGSPDVTDGGPLDVAAWRARLTDGSASEAFREDLRDARYREIGRFPTLLLERAGQPGILIVGYRPLAVLRRAVDAIAPDLLDG